MLKAWQQILQTSGARIYVLLAGLLSISITARFLGPEGRGLIAAAVSWVATFAIFGGLSLSQVVIFHATGKAREEWLPQTVGTLLVVAAMTAMVGWLTAVLGYVATNGAAFNHLRPGVLVLAFATLPLLLWVETGSSILMTLDSLRIFNIAQIVGASLNLTLVLLFVVRFGWGINGVLLAALVQQTTGVGIGLLYIFRQAGRVVVDRRVAGNLLLGGAKLHLNAIGSFLFSQVNILILNQFRTPQETGYYQIAVQLISAIQLVPIAINMVAYTFVTRDGPDRAWGRQRILLVQSVLLIAGVAIVASVLAPLAIQIIGGPAFGPAVPIFRILLFGTVGMTFSTIMASQWIARGLFIQTAVLTMVIGLVNVTANYLLIPQYGMYAAAWVTVGTYILSIFGNGAMAIWVEWRWRRSANQYA